MGGCLATLVLHSTQYRAQQGLWLHPKHLTGPSCAPTSPETIASADLTKPRGTVGKYTGITEQLKLFCVCVLFKKKNKFCVVFQVPHLCQKIPHVPWYLSSQGHLEGGTCACHAPFPVFTGKSKRYT